MAVKPPPLRCDVAIGTRPEAIKLAPVIRALRDQPREFCVHIVTSGQHREICRSALAAFGIAADSALDTEPVGCSLADSASDLVRAFGQHIAQSHPDLLLVQGDTTTAMGAALAGFYAKVPIAHVEAGPRAAISPILRRYSNRRQLWLRTKQQIPTLLICRQRLPTCMSVTDLSGGTEETAGRKRQAIG